MGCGGSSTLPQGRFTDFGGVNAAVNAISVGEYNRINIDQELSFDKGLETEVITTAFTIAELAIEDLLGVGGATTTASVAAQVDS